PKGISPSFGGTASTVVICWLLEISSVPDKPIRRHWPGIRVAQESRTVDSGSFMGNVLNLFSFPPAGFGLADTESDRRFGGAPAPVCSGPAAGALLAPGPVRTESPGPAATIA